MLESQSWASRQIQTNMGRTRYHESENLGTKARAKGKSKDWRNAQCRGDRLRAGRYLYTLASLR
jgi:hypothetical protein